MIYDVIISGAGPAGSICSYFLSNQNAKVLLLEKEMLPRKKICGGGITKRAKDMIPFDISKSIISSSNNITLDFQDINIKQTVKSEDPLIYFVDRKNFDNLLVKKAISAGSDLIENCKVKKVEIKKEHYNIITDKKAFICKNFICANGAKNNLLTDQKHLIDKLPAIECSITLKTPAKFSPYFLFINNGYIWSFPKNDIISTGIISFSKKNKSDLKTILLDHIQNINIKNIMKTDIKGHIIPIIKKTNSSVNMIFIGDSAGFVDPITAEGLYYAVLSGKLAAQSIIQNNFEFKSPLNTYNKLSYKYIIKPIKIAKHVSDFFYNNNILIKYFFSKNSYNLCNLMTKIIKGKSNYNKEIFKFGNYLKLLRSIM